MLVIATLPAVVLWFGMLIVPESPRWLAAKGRMGDALRVLRQIREDSRAQQEIKEIKHAIEGTAKRPAFMIFKSRGSGAFYSLGSESPSYSKLPVSIRSCTMGQKF